MKMKANEFKNAAGWSLALAGALVLTPLSALGSGIKAANQDTTTSPKETNANETASTGVATVNPVVVEDIEPGDPGEHFGQRETTWLGAAVDEAPTVLAAQLGLEPGSGLVVKYVATNSPAAKAGLQNNDLLMVFEGQLLVHPAQLRKLVQMRKEGDTVKLALYRAGKKQTVSATLGKNVANPAFQFDGGNGGPFWQFPDAAWGDSFREQMKRMREQMGNFKFDQRNVQEEIRRSMEEARKTYREALRQATNANSMLGPILRDLAKMGAAVDDEATVTVRSTGRSAKSLVQADESGTIVLVRNPRLHLTAHDKAGKLLFDGEIESSEQRDKVPHDLWSKVEPLLKKMGPEDEEQPATNAVPTK